METSIEVMALTIVAALAAVYAWVSDMRRIRRATRLIGWVREHYAEEWDALPWVARNLNRLGALAHLRRTKAIPHPRFEAEYLAIRPVQPRQTAALVVAIGAIALVLAGVRWWGWSW